MKIQKTDKVRFLGSLGYNVENVKVKYTLLGSDDYFLEECFLNIAFKEGELKKLIINGVVDIDYLPLKDFKKDFGFNKVFDREFSKALVDKLTAKNYNPNSYKI